jgi:GNAT superfamily N-acetyltransferase
MTIQIRQAHGAEVGELFPLLLLAEPSESALRWSLDHLSDTVYRMDDDGKPVGAATMRFEGEPCEIVELGIAPEHQGSGLGRQFVEWLVGEARKRGKAGVVVGTGNASIGNIVFYQKCGFRMHQVRRDYFWYYREPVIEHGIRVLDMLVFRYDLKTG